MTSTLPPQHPRPGMLATIRNRRGLIAAVEPFEGRLHLVRVEYTDSDGVAEDTVLWEREHGRDLLEPNALPPVQSEASMEPREFDALVRAARWAALTPFLHPDGSGRAPEAPISAPFFGAVQVDDFQLVPLLKALEMPRVSLLLADDVGLGKTIEAGLILTELLIRRRVRRVLILTPASLTQQWQREMKTKFSLNFDLIDRAETHALQRRLGLDANPWRTFPRIIASYYYLRHPVFHHALSTLARLRFPGSGRKQRDHTASRWAVRAGEVPKDADALILLTVEELAINELREPFHHWTRTYQIPVRQGDLGDPLPYQEPTPDRAGKGDTDAVLVEGARHIWEDAEPDLRAFVQSRAASLTEALKRRLDDVGRDALKSEQERFRLRLKEVERAMSENTIAKLEKERDQLIADMRQLTLIDIDRRAQEDRLRDLEAELQRRSSHFQELLTRLRAEQDRVLSLVLPKRYQLRQSAQVFPVAVEILLPEVAR